MADAYGLLVFSKSKDCSINAAKLVSKLNSYRWAQDNLEWCSHPVDVNMIYCDKIFCQYPTVYPVKTIRTQIQLKAGTEIWVDGVPELCDEDDILDIETAEVDLDSLCADISQAINVGWIEIGLIANEKLRYAYYQTLQIYSNGQGVRTYAMTGQQFSQGVTSEFTTFFHSI